MLRDLLETQKCKLGLLAFLDLFASLIPYI